MGKPGSCDANDWYDNAKFANRRYDPVSAKVVGRDEGAKTITVHLPHKPSGGGEYTLHWGEPTEMWAACPSSLPSSATPTAPGPLPSLNAEGELFLANDWLIQRPQIWFGAPKWPDGFPGGVETYAELEIYPDNLVLTGIELKTGNRYSGTIDLLDPELAMSGQPIIVARRALRLQLGEAGFEAFNVSSPSVERLADAVRRIVETAKPSSAKDMRELADAWRVVATWSTRVGPGGRDERSDVGARARELLKQVTRLSGDHAE